MRLRIVRGVSAALGVVLLAVAALTPFVGQPAAQAQQPVSELLMGMYGGYDDPRAMQVVDQAGATAMRIYVEWNLMQPYEAYNDGDILEASARAAFERQLRNITDVGLTPIVLIGEAPAWAASRPRGPMLPGMVSKYAKFVELLARTYKDAPFNVHYWELWPEPDAIGDVPQAVIARYGEDILKRRAWGDNGADYATMLKAAYPAIKRADPTAKVLNGAVAFDWFGRNSPGFNSGGIFNYSFLSDVIAAGGACCFDIVTFNSYAAFAPGWEEHSPGRDIAAKTNYLRAQLQQLGVNKPMMVMEVGFWSQGGAVPTRLHDGRVVVVQPDAQRHTSYLVQTYVRAASVGLQSVAWYTFRDQAYDNDKRGLVTETLEPKPAFYAYQQVAEQLRGATYVGPLQTSRLDQGEGEIEGYEFVRADGRRVAVLWLAGTLDGTAEAQFSFPTSGMTLSFNMTGGLASPPAADGGVVRQQVGTTPVWVVDAVAGHRLALPFVAKGG